MEVNRNQFLFATVLIAAIAHAAVYMPLPLWIRAPITLLFLFAVPGSIILSILSDEKIIGAERIIYTVAASISFIIFAGLVYNTLLPLFGVNNPLASLPIMLGFDLLLVALITIVYKKYANKIVFTIALPKLDTFNRVILVLPILAASGAIIGAKILNNGGTNTVSVVSIGIAAVTIFLLFVFRERIHSSSYGWALYFIALAVLYIGWMRSAYVSGVDIDVEYRVFQLTAQSNHWSINYFKDAYNACLSITILPTILRNLTGIPDMYIFKAVIPSVFALTPIAVYAFVRKYVSPHFAFLGSMFFITQAAFMLWWSIPVKQEVGLFFFSAIVLLLFSHNTPRRQQRSLLILFGLSMVVSHYTTTYLAAGIFLISLFVARAYETAGSKEVTKPILEKLKLKEPRRNIRKQRALPLLFVLILLGATYVWYFQITGTEGSTVRSANSIVSNLGNIFSDDVRQNDIVSRMFNPFYKEDLPQTVLQEYYEEVNTQANIDRTTEKLYPPSKYSDYEVTVIPDSKIAPRISAFIAKYSNTINELVKASIKVLLSLGVGLMLFMLLRKNNISADAAMLCTCSLITLAAIIFLPFASIVYSFSRAYQQLALILALPFSFALIFINRHLPKWSTAIIMIVILSPFLFYTGVAQEITGGYAPSVEFNNAGRAYEEVYTHQSDLLAGEWIFKYKTVENVHASSRAREKLWLVDSHNSSRVAVNVFPPKIHPEAFVYADYTNTIENKAFVATAGTTIAYPFPTNFLQTNKNLLYSNGFAQVYK